MKLVLKDIGIFEVEKIITIPDNVKLAIILEPSAAGKTTIARTLYTFLTGSIDSSLLRRGATSGYATFVYKNQKYVLTISPNKHYVDKVVKEPYGEYLVLTEGTPLYSIYVAPPRRITVDDLVKMFVKPPVELTKLENELKRLEPSAFDIDAIIDGYKDEIEKRRQRLEDLRRRLEEIEKKLANTIPTEKANVVLKKRDLESRVERLRRRLEEDREEHAKLLTEIQSTDYDDLKLRHKELGEEIERLHRRKDMLESAKEGFELIKQGLKRLQSVVDVLYELDVPLFGQLVSSDTIELFLNDAGSAIETITSKHAEIAQEISELERQKAEVDSILQDYIKKHDRITVLESEIRRLQNELKGLEYELSMIERKSREILAELGLSEDELIKKLLEQEDVARLMQRKKDLQREIERLEDEIASFQRALENAERQREEILKKKQEYEELRRKYNVLKNEWNRRRDLFKKTFKESFSSVFTNIRIRDFNPEAMEIYRPPHTYSQSERLMIAIAYQYALIKSLLAVGYSVPLVVVDLIVPLDSRWENEIKKLYKELQVNTLILKTSDVSKFVTEV
jgi:predicted  nucleic acid-binding Zn-ribbon protein